MKRTLLAVVTCLAIIVTGVFFTTSHAEAKTVFPHPGSTGCSAPAGGTSIGPCGTPSSEKASVSAPKHHWHHRHWHFHRHFHFHHHTHHFHARFHHHGGRHGHGHSGHHGHHHHH